MRALLRSIREAGWVVAVHNDYMQDGNLHTFWLFTKDGRAVKGEAETDEGALGIVFGQIFGEHKAERKEP